MFLLSFFLNVEKKVYATEHTKMFLLLFFLNVEEKKWTGYLA